MDSETRVFLRGVYGFLERYQKVLEDVQVSTLALRKTIRELGPQAEQIYAKHYQAELHGQTKADSDGVLEALAGLAALLDEPN
jgi:CHAD domain-containing protein